MSAPFDKRAIMRDAWKRYRDGQRLNLGWTFGHCLSTAWAAAKLRREWAMERADLERSLVSNCGGRLLTSEVADELREGKTQKEHREAAREPLLRDLCHRNAQRVANS